MAEISWACPHCGTELAGFVVYGASHRGTAKRKFEDVLTEVNVWNTLCQCKICQGAIIVEFNTLYATPHNPTKVKNDPRKHGFEVECVYPEKAEITPPEHLPETLRLNFIEAESNLHDRRFTSSVVLFRRIIEVATLEIDDSLSSKDNLRSRIDKLEQSGLITQGMKDWAEIIRLEGNEAAHAQDADEETARQLHAYTKAFLEYCFSLPRHVNQYKKEAVSSQKKTN